MVHTSQLQAVVDWMPNVLAGVTLPKMLVGDYMNKPIAPSMSIGIISDGVRTQHHDSMLETKKDVDGILTDYYGHYIKLTLAVHIRTYDKAERDQLTESFIEQIWKNRLQLNWFNDKIKFKDVISPNRIYFSDRDEQLQKKLYRSVIDLEFEYEFRYASDEPVLTAIGVTMGVGQPASTILDKVLRIRNYEMSVLLGHQAHASITMGVRLV
jgi:hypothetical protein